MTAVQEADDHIDWPSVVATHEAWHGSACNSRCEVMEFARAALQAAPISIDRGAGLRTAIERLKYWTDGGRRECWCPPDWDHGWHTDTCIVVQEAIAEYDRLSHAE